MIRAALFVVFLVVPFVEALIFVEVGQGVGFGWAILLIVAISVAGALLVKREGLRAWRRFRVALAAGRSPAEEVVDGALVLVGGALLLTPGFLTDAVGLALLFAPARSLVNRALRARVRASLGLGRGSRASRSAPPRDDVIDVEVVSVERNQPPRDADPLSPPHGARHPGRPPEPRRPS